MSDHTLDPHDEILRAAMEAEAVDVEAGPELLDRVRTAAAAPSHPRVAPWLLAAAAIVAVVGIGAVLLRDDDQSVDSSNDPTSTTTTEVQPPYAIELLPLRVPCVGGEALDLAIYLRSDATDADVDALGRALEADSRVTSARYLDHETVRKAMVARIDGLPEVLMSLELAPSGYVVDLADGVDETALRGEIADRAGVFGTFDIACELAEPTDVPPTGEPPTFVTLVREDGWLMTIDLKTGEQRELHFVGDPTGSSDVEEGGPYFINSVDLSPDGQWVYFSTCCEPVGGNTYRIPTQGGEPELFAVGSAPRVSPDGRYLATGAGEMAIVTAIDGPRGNGTALEVECCTRSLAWSPDGTQLAVVNGTGAPGETAQVLVFGWDGAVLTPKDIGKPDNPGAFASWTPDGTLTISGGGSVADDRSLSQDRSYGWLLWVDEAGVVRQQAGQESGDRPPIDRLPKALAADW